MRLANLAAIKLGANLIKPDGPASNYWLVFPDYDVKNRIKLEYPLPQYLTELIDEYVHDFRPTLMRGTNEDGWSKLGLPWWQKHRVAHAASSTVPKVCATAL